MVKRLVNISKKHSFFLLGPRATGKSTLLKQHFPEKDHLWIDLLDPQIERRLSLNPNELIEIINQNTEKNFVVIDEIQKIPQLLDVVHKVIFETKRKFVLTGSSARKLKKGGANLLAGRAFSYKCHPLTYHELGEKFQLDEMLSFGGLPSLLDLDIADKKDYLRSYVEIYFKEEVVAEQLVRNLKPFRNFLDIASQANGKILNIHNIAKQVGVDDTTVQNYFEILEDTLVAFMLPPYHASVRKRQRQKSKFYFFDLGVQRALSGKLELPLQKGTFEYGNLFEHFLILEIKRMIDYKKPDWKISYLKSGDDAEIDLIIERPGEKTVLIEIKSTNNTNELDEQKLVGFKKLSAAIENSITFLVSQDPIEKKQDHVHYLYWENLFSKIGM
jgi:predicted AAA+ superfamily ATPase